MTQWPQLYLYLDFEKKEKVVVVSKSIAEIRACENWSKSRLETLVKVFSFIIKCFIGAIGLGIVCGEIVYRLDSLDK